MFGDRVDAGPQRAENFLGQTLGRHKGADRAASAKKSLSGLVEEHARSDHGAIPWLFPLIPLIPRLSSDP
jgi:hypothetical protein